MSQVIAILSGVASRTLLQAITQLAGFSLGRLGWGLRMGLEGWGGGRSRGERRKQSWEHSACHRVTASLHHGGVLKSVRWSGPSSHIMGGGGGGGILGSKLCSCCRHLRQEKPSKNKQAPLLLCPPTQTENPKQKRVTSFFLSTKGLLKETDCKLPSLLLLLLFLDGYKDSVRSHT